MADEDDIDPIASVDAPPPEEAAKTRAEEAAAKARLIIETRQRAYTRWWKGKAMADDAKIVAEDLRRFCRGDETAFDTNDRIHCLLTGRQEVWQRIKDYTTLTVDEILMRVATKEGA